MTDLILHTHPMSRGRIARWMLEETGAKYEVRVLGFGDMMRSDDYLAINPMGKVPAIEHKGKVVTENAAICAYLADAFPEAGLAPPVTGRADYYRWLFFAAGPVEHAVTNQVAGFIPSADQGRMFGYGSFDRAVAVLEHAVSRNPYVAGDSFTAADVYVGSQVMWGTQFGTLPRRAAFDDYAARLAGRLALIRAGQMDDALAEIDQIA